MKKKKKKLIRKNKKKKMTKQNKPKKQDNLDSFIKNQDEEISKMMNIKEDKGGLFK